MHTIHPFHIQHSSLHVYITFQSSFLRWWSSSSLDGSCILHINLYILHLKIFNIPSRLMLTFAMRSFLQVSTYPYKLSFFQHSSVTKSNALHHTMPCIRLTFEHLNGLSSRGVHAFWSCTHYHLLATPHFSITTLDLALFIKSPSYGFIFAFGYSRQQYFRANFDARNRFVNDLRRQGGLGDCSVLCIFYAGSALSFIKVGLYVFVLQD